MVEGAEGTGEGSTETIWTMQPAKKSKKITRPAIINLMGYPIITRDFKCNVN